MNMSTVLSKGPFSSLKPPPSWRFYFISDSLTSDLHMLKYFNLSFFFFFLVVVVSDFLMKQILHSIVGEFCFVLFTNNVP